MATMVYEVQDTFTESTLAFVKSCVVSRQYFVLTALVAFGQTVALPTLKSC